MKKKITIIISILIVLLLVCIVNILFINNGYINRQIDNFKSEYELFYNNINKFPIYDEGKLDINANYRGAHGENNPNRFVFDYKLDNSIVSFSNEVGFKDYEYDNKITELIKGIRKIDVNTLEEILKESKIENNKLIIDEKKINNITNFNIENISITFESTNIIKKLKRIVINIDDVKISIEDKIINIDYKDNHINVKINSSGYYLSINDTLKMNAFINDNKNTYSIVIGDKVLRVEVSDNELKVLGGFESAIYNSIEITATKGKTNIVKNNELELNDVPILRYFTNTDLSFWN